MLRTSMGCMLNPANGSMSVLRWWTAWMCLYRARMWMNLAEQVSSDIIGFSGKQQLESPVRKVEVNTTKERNKEERENEDGDVGKA